jgi:hypothetical protein
MAKAGRNGADIVLRTKNGSTEVPLELFQRGEIPGGYRSRFAALQAQQIQEGPANNSSQPAEAGLNWTERGWDQGAGQVYHADAMGPDTGADLRRYAHSEGVLAQFDGKATLGYQEDWSDTTLQNGRANQVGAYGNTAVLLAEALDTTETGVDVDDGDYFTAGDLIQVTTSGNAEIMKVVSISTNTLTVIRGVAGTIAIAHSNNDAVQMQAATGWDDNSNITDAFISADSKTGDYSIKFSTETGAGYLGQRYKATDSVLNGQGFQFGGYAKRITGSGSLSAQVVDNGASHTAGSTVSSSEYTYFETTGTLSGSLTTIDFRLITSASGDVWVVDDMFVIITNANGEWTKVVRFKGSNSNHEFYAASGRSIFKWDETDDVFYSVYFSDSANDISDLEEFDDGGTAGVLYAGRGTGDNYLRSTDGATFSDPTTPTGNAAKAELFLKVRNANGDSALMKTRTNKAAFTTNPSNTANWGTEIKVGDVDHSVTSLFSVNDAGYVGKEDGLWVYNPVDNLFEDIEPDANFFPHPNNYKRAIGRAGSIWSQGGDHAFFKIDPIGDDNNFVWTDISKSVSFPEWAGFGGGVRSLATDRKQVWAVLDGADKQVTESQKAIAQTGANRNSSSEGNNNPWRASDGGSLSNAIATRGDGVSAVWDFNSGLVTQIVSAGDNSDHLQAQWGSNNPSIPAAATITGVRVIIYHENLFGADRFWSDVSLLGTSGTSPSTDRIGTAKSATVAETKTSSTSFGSSTDTWGATLTPAICSDADFGIEAQLEADALGFMMHTVDAVELQIYYTEAGSDRSRVVSVVQDNQGMRTHTVTTVLLENPDRISRMYDAGNTLSSLFILGRTNNADANADELRAYRVRMPVADQDPSAVLVPQLRRSGSIFSSWMDFFFPDVDKAQLSLTILSRNLIQDERTITASYKTDNATNDDNAEWIPWGDGGTTNDGTFDTSPSETQLATLTTPQTFKRIRLRFDFESDQTDEEVEMTGFVLKAAWNPDRVGAREWDLQATIGNAPASDPQRRGQRYPASLTDLDTLAGEAFIEMEEYRGAGDNTVVTHTVTITQMTESFFRHETQGNDGTAEQQRVITLSLTEMDV